ncbi:GntR family transcriptional regulator [Palleronia sp. LCG004]|uniref:GntR family transcriptional regulator n=1 Tax=Palleronia sp. LCG004 TaxID=3079304 RepID=UPI0029421664|nr:GntR family transcriptional regulator [Palleronia sp. LCG004]WOI54837.1 GntR family transcriptional regulator [Palleronia sp. LCG004]
MDDLTLAPFDDEPAITATERVFQTLYRAIVTIRLPPGTKVSEAEIARRLNVSRQPVRDAFFRLSMLGYLSIRPQRATLITAISDEDVRRASFIRSALESACIRAAAAALTDRDIAALREILARQGRAVEADDRDRFHRLDDAFHGEICRIGGHAYVWPLIDEQKGHMDRVRILSLLQTTRIAFDEHLEIVEALAARDADAAVQAVTRHIMRIARVLPEIRAAHPRFFD